MYNLLAHIACNFLRYNIGHVQISRTAKVVLWWWQDFVTVPRIDVSIVIAGVRLICSHAQSFLD